VGFGHMARSADQHKQKGDMGFNRVALPMRKRSTAQGRFRNGLKVILDYISTIPVLCSAIPQSIQMTFCTCCVVSMPCWLLPHIPHLTLHKTVYARRSVKMLPFMSRYWRQIKVLPSRLAAD